MNRSDIEQFADSQPNDQEWIQFCEELLESETNRAVKIVTSKKLPVPNPYGTTVKVTKYNQVMDSIIKALKETTKGVQQ